jgi:DNA polymerase III delta' subunit
MLQLSDIFGQTSAIGTLLRAIATDRLPHGLVFAGPVGVGKGTTARALAGLFLCDRPQGDAACGECPGCIGMQSGNHPDYHVIYRELIRYHDKGGKSKGIDLSINVIRPELIDPANRKSTLGRGKVFVVEEAETMNPAAQNSLLKTLEEPAGRTIIILLTDQPEGLLQTVRSRCQMIRFAALDRKLVTSELARRGVDPAVAEEAATWSAGSLGAALKLIEDGVAAPARELTGKIDGLLAGRPAADLPDWLKKAAEAYADKQIERDELASKDAATRAGLTLYLRLAAQRFRAELTREDDPDRLERACAAIDAIAQAERYLDANVNVSIALQNLSAVLGEVLV